MATLTTAALELVPKHPSAQEALRTALVSSTQAIINHAFKTYIYALAYASSSTVPKPRNDTITVYQVSIEPHVLFVAYILHDLATIEDFDNTTGRFEVFSANIAIQMLRKHEIHEASLREAWLAMTLHATPGIAEHVGGVVGAVRAIVRTDFGGRSAPLGIVYAASGKVLDELPQLGIEKEFGHAVAGQGIRDRSKAP